MNEQRNAQPGHNRTQTDDIADQERRGSGIIPKDHTCKYWWLRACCHTEEKCEYAHRLWNGRTRRHANLKECLRLRDGKCMWPARLCHWDHGVERSSHVLKDTDEDRLKVTEGVMFKHCDAWFANEADMTRHLPETDEQYHFPCQVLKKLREATEASGRDVGGEGEKDHA